MKKKVIISLGLAALVVAAVYVYNSRNLSIPANATAVRNFEVQKYLGQWYEIARLDHRFEKDMEKVTATYSLNEDGSVKVDNKGYDTLERKWKQSVGVAKFIRESGEGRLKVSFFRPFYSAYNILSIDGDYKYALVVGQSPKYLWFLSRERSLPEPIREKYFDMAASVGCKVGELIWVRQ